MNDTRLAENDTRLTARDFIRKFEKLARGHYALTKYGKPWRRVTIASPADPGLVITEIDRGDGSPGSASITVQPVDCVAAAPVPGLVVGKVEPLKAPVGDMAKLADLLARGRATVSQGPADNPPPAVKARVPAEWRAWSVERRRRWLKVNRLDLTRGEDCEERITEWVEAG